MPLPPLLLLPDETAFRAYYIEHYCSITLTTIDGISVRFYPQAFDHAFRRDSSRTANDKAVFDTDRAQRMEWIRAVLTDPVVVLYRRVMPDGAVRRIALEPHSQYAVIIQLGQRDPTQARFITAYIVDSESALRKMRSNPRWI